MDINHNMCTMAAIEAQEAGRELSRLEASVIAQYLCGSEGDFYHDIHYRPNGQNSSAAEIIAQIRIQNYEHARWDEKIAWDMLGTYCLNVPSM